MFTYLLSHILSSPNQLLTGRKFYHSLLYSQRRCVKCSIRTDFFNFKEFVYLCINVPPAHMCIHYVHVWCPQRPEEDFVSPGTGVMILLSQHVGAGNRNQVLFLQEKQVKPSLQFPKYLLAVVKTPSLGRNKQHLSPYVRSQ